MNSRLLHLPRVTDADVLIVDDSTAVISWPHLTAALRVHNTRFFQQRVCRSFYKSRLKTFLFSQAFSLSHKLAAGLQRLWSYDLMALYKSVYYYYYYYYDYYFPPR